MTLDRLKCCHRSKIPVPLPTSFNTCFLYRTLHITTIYNISVLLNKKNEDARIVSLLAQKELYRWHWRWVILCPLREGTWWIGSLSVRSNVESPCAVYGTRALYLLTYRLAELA